MFFRGFRSVELGKAGSRRLIAQRLWYLTYAMPMLYKVLGMVVMLLGSLPAIIALIRMNQRYWRARWDMTEDKLKSFKDNEHHEGQMW